MSSSIPSVVPRDRGAAEGLWPTVITNAFFGLPAYFIAFLFAYGFREEVGVTEHATFLVLITIFASVTGLVATALATAIRPTRSFAGRAAFCVQMSVALNSAVVGAGSIVSATHKDENSVSVGFSTTTDVLIATGLFVLAADLAVVAVRRNVLARGHRRP
jgi:hypothetical protein